MLSSEYDIKTQNVILKFLFLSYCQPGSQFNLFERHIYPVLWSLEHYKSNILLA